MGKRTLSSRLLKADKVVAKTESILIGKREYEENFQESPHQPRTMSTASLEQLNQELETLKAKAQQELEDWRKQEEERFLQDLEEQKRLGYEEGYQLGYQDGTTDASNNYKGELQKAAAVLEQAYQEKFRIIQEAEPFIIELTTEIANKVLQQEMKQHPESLFHLIKQTLETVYETSSITIGVAPEDFSFVQKQREQLLAFENGQVEVKIVPDYSIEQGGCIIRTSSGSVDARIDVQLSEIKKALLAIAQGESHD
jgi:flagellar assembly protein FliH